MGEQRSKSKQLTHEPEHLKIQTTPDKSFIRSNWTENNFERGTDLYFASTGMAQFVCVSSGTYNCNVFSFN